MTIISAIALIICSILCAKLANDKSRNPYIAALAGFLFGLMALTYYVFINKKVVTK